MGKSQESFLFTSTTDNLNLKDIIPIIFNNENGRIIMRMDNSMESVPTKIVMELI